MAGENYLARRKGQVTQSSIRAGATGGVVSNPYYKPPTKVNQPRPGIVGSFVDKTADIARGTANIAGTIAKKTGGFVANRSVDIAKSAYLTAKTPSDVFVDRYKNKTIQSYRQNLDENLSNATSAYKSGKMSKQNYKDFLKAYSEASQKLSQDSRNIAEAPSGTERAAAIVDTATNVASFGAIALAKGTGKEAGKVAVRSLVGGKPDVLTKQITKLEAAATKIPAVKALIERNAKTVATRSLQKLAGETTGQYLARQGKHAVFALYIKQPIFYQTNIGGAQEISNDILEGNYSDALKQSAWLSTQMLNGGPLGATAKGFSWLKNRTGKLAYGQGSYIDEMSKKIGNKQSNQIGEYLNGLDKTSDEYKKAERVLRITQETNLQMAGENAKDAAERTLVHWAEAGINFDDITPKKVVDLLENWATANETLATLGRAGKLGKSVQQNLPGYVVVRWDVDAKNALAKQFEEASDDVNELASVIRNWADHPGNAAGNNDLLLKRLDKIVTESINNPQGSVQQTIAKKVRDISAVSVMPKGIPAGAKKQFEKLGFTIARPYQPKEGPRKLTPSVVYDETRKLVTSAIKGDDDYTEAALSNQFVNRVANGLQRAGISIEASTRIATAKLSQNVAARLSSTLAGREIGLVRAEGNNFDKGGQVILQKLQEYVDTKTPNKLLNVAVLGKAPGPAITDIRQLTNGEIREALGVTKSQARQIMGAINKGYMDTTMEYRGLGDRVVDTLYSVNPLHKHYSRIQSALRYTYNPFFRFQEKVETSLLSRAQARTIMWKQSKQELDEGAEILDKAGLFKNGLSGEAAQDLTLGRVTATITQGQKRNIAGLAYRMAEARGTTIDDLVRNHGDEVGDALRVVVQYPNKGILNSSLARTLNLAFFPMRYNAKVTALAAQIISKEPPSVQLAMINSIFDLRDWLKSDEGIRWRADNADAIAVFEWATPIGSINYWNKIFLDGDPNAPGDFGAIGGLPLGILTQALDSQGIINLNKPYVNPETGDVLPKYLPQTSKARASVALTDLLGSLFTYPGRILGLPGKNQSLNKLSQELTGAEGVDFEKDYRLDDLTPMQLNMIRVLKGDTSEEALDALYRSPAPGQFNGYTLPPPVIPLVPQREAPVERRSGLPTKAQKKAAAKSSKTPRVKTALPIPQR